MDEGLVPGPQKMLCSGTRPRAVIVVTQWNAYSTLPPDFLLFSIPLVCGKAAAECSCACGHHEKLVALHGKCLFCGGRLLGPPCSWGCCIPRVLQCPGTSWTPLKLTLFSFTSKILPLFLPEGVTVGTSTKYLVLSQWCISAEALEPYKIPGNFLDVLK